MIVKEIITASGEHSTLSEEEYPRLRGEIPEEYWLHERKKFLLATVTYKNECVLEPEKYVSTEYEIIYHNCYKFFENINELDECISSHRLTFPSELKRDNYINKILRNINIGAEIDAMMLGDRFLLEDQKETLKKLKIDVAENYPDPLAINYLEQPIVRIPSVNNELPISVGGTVSKIVIQDYPGIELKLYENRIIIFPHPKVIKQKTILSDGEPGYYDALCELLSTELIRVDDFLDVRLALEFSNGTFLAFLDNENSPTWTDINDYGVQENLRTWRIDFS